MNVDSQALIIGSSIAGLWSARVLADHFDQVIIIERDQLPAAPQSRSGVPQDKHIHVLLARGMELASELFPGIGDELAAAGAVPVNLSLDVRSKLRGKWLQRFASPYHSYGCSRILFEQILRKRLRSLSNVRFVEATQAVGLVVEGNRVTGVQIRAKGAERPETLPADFVVDASGRSSQTPTWLAAIGFPTPEETVVDAQVGYAGRRFRKPADFADNWHIMLIGAEPPHKSRQGVIYEEGDGVWMVMLAGMMGDYPPTHDDAAYLDFAYSIEPDLHAAIAQAEPLTGIFGYRRTETRVRHYERLDRWPERFVVLGDAAYAFNPIYGQGMSVAALSAVALGELFGSSNGLDGVARQFQQRLSRVVEPALLLAIGADQEWIGRPPNQPFSTRARQWYLSHLLDAIPDERKAHLAFSSVQHLMQPPTALVKPDVVARVLWHWWRGQ